MSVQDTLAGVLGRTPTVSETASALGVERSVVEAALADAAPTLTPLDDVVVDTVAAETPRSTQSLPTSALSTSAPQSRITARRRHDYLSTLATATLGGITRGFAAHVPALNQAV